MRGYIARCCENYCSVVTAESEIIAHSHAYIALLSRIESEI